MTHFVGIHAKVGRTLVADLRVLAPHDADAWLLRSWHRMSQRVPNRRNGKYSGKVTMTTPFGTPVQEVPLSRAPLVNVIAQVRFPAVMKIEADSGFVATSRS